MAGETANRHPIWLIVDRIVKNAARLPVTFEISATCMILVNTNGTSPTLTIQSTWERIPKLREVYVLDPEGTLEVNVTADILSGLTGKIHVGTAKARFTVEDQTRNNIQGFNRAREQMDVLYANIREKFPANEE